MVQVEGFGFELVKDLVSQQLIPWGVSEACKGLDILGEAIDFAELDSMLRQLHFGLLFGIYLLLYLWKEPFYTWLSLAALILLLGPYTQSIFFYNIHHILILMQHPHHGTSTTDNNQAIILDPI